MNDNVEDRMHGYLYSIWSGELRIYEGRISTGSGRRADYGRSTFISERRFLDDGTIITYRGVTMKRTMCSSNPYEVVNAVVWLSERDDNRARGILIEYEKDCIAVLQEKIDNHKSKIRILENS